MLLSRPGQQRDGPQAVSSKLRAPWRRLLTACGSRLTAYGSRLTADGGLLMAAWCRISGDITRCRAAARFRRAGSLTASGPARHVGPDPNPVESGMGTPRRWAPSLVIAAIASLAPAAGRAQVCAGLPSLRERPVVLGGSYSGSRSGWSLGGDATLGRAAFVNLAAGHVVYRNVDFGAVTADAHS